MKSALAKMFLLALPLAGMLLAAPPADAQWWRHHHHCRPYAEQSWYYRNGRYNDNNGYYGRRGWYGDDYYPSRYPYRRSEDPRYYYGGYPWWNAWPPR